MKQDAIRYQDSSVHSFDPVFQRRANYWNLDDIHKAGSLDNVKGRAMWFNAEIPESWEGREFLPKLERHEADEIGLADWVDEQILVSEQS